MKCIVLWNGNKLEKNIWLNPMHYAISGLYWKELPNEIFDIGKMDLI